MKIWSHDLLSQVWFWFYFILFSRSFIVSILVCDGIEEKIKSLHFTLPTISQVSLSHLSYLLIDLIYMSHLLILLIIVEIGFIVCVSYLDFISFRLIYHLPLFSLPTPPLHPIFSHLILWSIFTLSQSTIISRSRWEGGWDGGKWDDKRGRAISSHLLSQPSSTYHLMMIK